jgi:hypothetical protein
MTKEEMLELPESVKERLGELVAAVNMKNKALHACMDMILQTTGLHFTVNEYGQVIFDGGYGDGE